MAGNDEGGRHFVDEPLLATSQVQLIRHALMWRGLDRWKSDRGVYSISIFFGGEGRGETGGASIPLALYLEMSCFACHLYSVAATGFQK